MLRMANFEANKISSKNIDRETGRDDAARGIEDRVFPTTFLLLKAIGVWVPTTMRLRLCCICYKIYSTFCLISVVILIATVSIECFASDGASLLENWYLLVILSHGLLKFSNLLWRRAKIAHLLDKLIMDKRWSYPRNGDERRIIMKSKRSEKFVTKLWFTLIVINGMSGALKPIIFANPSRDLVFDSFSLCDRSIDSCFWTSYALQCFGYAVSSTVHVGSDCLVFNFIERIDSHMKIFIDRLEKLPGRLTADESSRDDVTRETPATCEALLIKDCVRDHQEIYRSVEELNNTFYELITVQFVTTISILCTNIYFLSKQELFSSGFLAVFTFLTCVLAQNFMFCWYGYKLSERSSRIVDAVFNMNWFVFGKRSRSSLLFIMMSASKEMKIFNSALVNLSPETFLKLVKMSYSAFNLLQQSR